MEDGWGNIDFGWGTEPDIRIENKTERAKSFVTKSEKHEYRRAFSESHLLDCTGFSELKEGERWHFISAGDVDSLSYLKLVIRHQKLHYCLFATWVMAAGDIETFDEWLTDGRIEKLDCYLGEIFPGSYEKEWKMLNAMVQRHKCGRVAVFRNHAKVYAGYGDKFHFAIESSANINTNPRTEQTCIEISKPLYQFYRDYFDGIVSFEKKQ